MRLGPYELVRLIAIGGMAEVHLAKLSGIAGFEKFVALKTLHANYADDHDVVNMLIDEAKLAVQLTHPNIAQTFDLGRVGDTYYISMEYVDGIDVWRLLRAAETRNQPLPFDACAQIAADVSAALEHAHTRCDADGRPLKVVHRDVSPRNVMISYDGVVKLVDFGIAKAAASRQTKVGVIKGKYYYLSPEQAWGRPVDARSDIYSAGIVLYELITGRPIHQEEDTLKLIELTREGRIRPPHELRRDVPPQLERIVLRALEVAPELRFQHARELANELHDFLREYAPQYSAASLATLVAGLVRHDDGGTEQPPMLNAEEVADLGRSIFDENSVIGIERRSRETIPRLSSPATFERFEVREQLGWSALATVYRATLGAREVALKRLAPELADDPQFCRRFADELAHAVQLRHPNLVETLEHGCVQRVHFVVMELVHGVALRALLRRSQPAPVAVAISITMQLLDALVAVHEHTVHGGVTTGNVMITRDGTVKLADLGVARALRDIATPTRGYEGATETIVDARTDVFAVGVLAWEMITGRKLFDASGDAPMDIVAPSKHNENCDASLDRIVLSALARRRSDRVRSARAMREALEIFADHVDTKRVAAWANAIGPSSVRRPDTDHEIKISIDDGSKQIEIKSYLLDRPKPVRDDTHEESKDVEIILGED